MTQSRLFQKNTHLKDKKMYVGEWRMAKLKAQTAWKAMRRHTIYVHTDADINRHKKYTA